MSKVKSLIKGVTKARENLMTAAQKGRARKTQKDLGPSARRDMKESSRELSSFAQRNAKKRKQRARRKKFGEGMSASDQDALTALTIAGPIGITGAAAAGKEMADRSRLNREAKRKAFDRAREKAKLRNNPTFTVSGDTYNTETGRKVEKKAKGGMASAAKTITSKTTRSRNKTKPRGVGVALRGYGRALK
jgi:hypothetical protein